MATELGFSNRQFAALMVKPEDAEIASVKVELGLDGSLSYVDDEGVHWTNIGNGWLSSAMVSVMLRDDDTIRDERKRVEARLIDRAVTRYREYIKRRLEDVKSAKSSGAQDDDKASGAG